jgi:hypothetical protein
MMDQAIHDYGREKVFQKQTLDRWLKLPEPDREALLELARGPVKTISGIFWTGWKRFLCGAVRVYARSSRESPLH